MENHHQNDWQCFPCSRNTWKKYIRTDTSAPLYHWDRNPSPCRWFMSPRLLYEIKDIMLLDLQLLKSCRKESREEIHCIRNNRSTAGVVLFAWNATSNKGYILNPTVWFETSVGKPNEVDEHTFPRVTPFIHQDPSSEYDFKGYPPLKKLQLRLEFTTACCY